RGRPPRPLPAVRDGSKETPSRDPGCPTSIGGAPPRPARMYCASVSRTTAPLTGDTRRYFRARPKAASLSGNSVLSSLKTLSLAQRQVIAHAAAPVSRDALFRSLELLSRTSVVSTNVCFDRKDAAQVLSQ